jgi:hypothetical protein
MEEFCKFGAVFILSGMWGCITFSLIKILIVIFKS